MIYGKKNAYFGSAKQGFQNSVWVELIGFDCELPDYGVGQYLEELGFRPQVISLHMTSIDFVNTYRGMEAEYTLPRYACSYGGHERNDLRQRQAWTNTGLRGLTRALKDQGIKVLGSFFDMDSENGQDGVPLFTELHPELLPAGGKAGMETGIVMIKRFADGSYYEDYLLKKLLETAEGYGFDGYQLADGISSLRSNMWYSDFSDDLLEQAGIGLPEGAEDRSAWIWANRRREWRAFYRRRWSSFLDKLIRGLREKGLLVMVNSAWTRDPVEALVRYGVDYGTIARADATSLVVEDVSSDLAILSQNDNHGYRMSYEARKMVHYNFLANLMCLRAYLPRTKLTPLFMIWDNQEQWDVLHHAPTAMQRAGAANFSNFLVTKEGLKTITDGPHFCLGDSIRREEWEFIRRCIDNGYSEHPCETEGAAFLWSDERMEREAEELDRCGLCHSAQWLALLQRAGAQIHKIIRSEDLCCLKGDLVVTNFSLLSVREQEMVRNYKEGEVLYLERPGEEEAGGGMNPGQDGWPYPLKMCLPQEEYVKAAAIRVNAACNARIAEGDGFLECTLTEIRTGPETARILVENNEYYYAIPTIRTRRKVVSVKAITKPEGYRTNAGEHHFSVRVPGRGADILEIVYEKSI